MQFYTTIFRAYLNPLFKCEFYRIFHNLIISDLMTTISVLPKRVVGNYLKSCEKQQIKTNLFKVEFSEKALITIYSLAIQPQLPHDSTKLHSIVDSAKQQLTQQVGNYLLSGRTIYGCSQSQKNRAKETIIKIDAKLEKQTYALTLKPVRVVDLSALSSVKENQTFMPLNFLNNLMKKFFRSLKFVSIGKNGKFFNPKSRQVLSNSGIILFNGYQTKFNIAQNGVYLQVDSMVRIVQSRTVLEQIDLIYNKNAHLNKDQKRMVVKNELINKAVMANYGNSRIWVIKDILFDFDLQKNKIGEQSNLNFIEYYEKSYGLRITKKKQPVIKALMNGSKQSKNAKQKQSILIPQFFLMSGLPEDFDQRKRRDISQYTIINPEQKLNRIESLIHSFNSDNENFCPNSVSESLGVKISKVTETVDAIILPPPVIQLGHGQSIEKNKVANFQLFNKQIYNHDIPIPMLVLIPHDFDFAPIQKLFVSTCRNLCIKHNMNIIRINYSDTKKCLGQIQKIIQDKDGKFDDYDVNWFIMPPPMKPHYKTIKRLSLKNQNPKITQVTLTTTLSKKGFASVLTKVLIQISSKVGNVPWMPRVPTALPQKTILIGIDTCKEGKNNVVAYCCTINKQLNKFHSNYHYQPLTNKYNAKMGDIIADCLASYSKANSYLPEQIIIIKADLSDGEKENIVLGQIAQIRARIKDMNNYNPKLTFLTANKGSKQKLFMQSRIVTNPGYGTLVNNKIVSKFYDFYLVSQHCNRGTVKPIHYKVLYSDSKMEQGVLQQLIYCQSFNYMNWSGSVRVPSVLQYATKLSTFVADYIARTPQTDQLNELLYFI